MERKLFFPNILVTFVQLNIKDNNMRKQNLWMAALAMSLTLSVQAQQGNGGISQQMLQQIKQSYQGTPTDKALHNAIANNDINKLAVNTESLNNFDTYFSNNHPDVAGYLQV